MFEIEEEKEENQDIENDIKDDFEENIIEDDEYFDGFDKAKEEFEEPEKKATKKEDEDLFPDHDKPAIISKSAKKELSSTIVNMFTATLNDLLIAITGTADKNRYSPSNESKKEMEKVLSILLPDTVGNTPPWLQLAIIFAMAYTPIAMSVREDLKLKKLQDNLDEENNEQKETKIVNFSEKKDNEKKHNNDNNERKENNENNETNNNSGT